MVSGLPGKLNLSHSFELFKIREKLEHLKPCAFNTAIKEALQKEKLKDAIAMIQEQRAAGHEQSMEWCVGRSTLDLIDKLNKP